MGQKKAILIVEDDGKLSKMLSFLFAAKGFDARIANSGKEALETLKGWKPNIMLLDLMMPEMNGFEVCEKVKGDVNLKDIPIIVLSALTEEKHRQRVLELGAIDYFCKPFTSTALVNRVLEVLEGK